MLKDKLFLVMLVLGLLTIVAAAGVITMKREGGQNPYMNMEDGENILAKQPEGNQDSLAGESDAQLIEALEEEEQVAVSQENPDNVLLEDTYQVAEASLNETEEEQQKEETAARVQDEGNAVAAGSGLDAATALVLDFNEASRMAWPVRGNVILDYSMDSTIYFPTLDQYKCNSAVVIQGEVSDPVSAPANARVLEIGANEEIGNYLRLDLGNGYTATCGQLKEIAAVEGEYLEKGQLIGYVAEPTKYYTIEGSNIFFELKHGEETADPMDYLE